MALWAMTGVLLLYSVGIVVVLLILSAVVIGFSGWWVVRQHHPVVVEKLRPRRQPNAVNR
ncbi:hypothetical protein GCM10022251_08670 [Phytohabitans flavus]|uniref:Uncharacterized protein n=1 Tax=Phytohabitans flavus TaxID=1076124 RepID=A0A6F8Y1G1_9ACTN|nr:hypothetical protein Pflav_063540 [Phytohabitans flavus]